jgi:putative Mn2+ efflux pump MntP
MSFFEAFILALALCVDTLVVSSATALRSKMSYRRGLLLALILGFCQFAFPLVGALIGDVARSFIEAVDHWIAFGLLAFIGGKMIWEGIKGGEEELKAPDSRRSLVYGYFLLGVATSIDGLAVGIGLGLDNPMRDVLWIVTTIGVVTFIVAQVGVFLGKRNIPVPERTANIIAGVVLIGLGLKILLEHLLA